MSNVVPEANESMDQPSIPPQKKRRPVRILGLLLVIFSVLVGWFLLVAYLGWQSGQQALFDKQVAQLERQITLAEADIDQTNYQLALTRLDWVLARDPKSAQAQTLREQALSGLGATPTATPVTAVTVTPASTRLPTATPGAIGSPNDELLRIRRLVTTKFWDEALLALTAFQQQFPSYEREETDQLLYDVYLNYGLEMISGKRVELGMYYLAQAQKLGNLPQSAQDYQTWARLYTQGISFYGVNWEASAYYFRDLCLAAPFYQSSCQQLFTVLVSLGDQYAFAEEWCPAQALYEEASRQQTTAVLTEKRLQAQENCLLATPTPSEPIFDTEPITDTNQLEESLPFLLPTATPSAP
jgi:tetratricopeptide (TPR) repeat protein